jgi:hypothetical protein
VSEEELDRYEAQLEIELFKEYRQASEVFAYTVETDRRFYLANDVKVTVESDGAQPYFRIDITDAWVWDMYRTRARRFVTKVQVLTFKDVNIEELTKD